jgi:hypothetical protein
MAKFTNVAGEPLTVGYGFPGLRRVDAGGVLEVPDEAAAAYDGQPAIWQRVSPAAVPAVAAPVAAVPIPVEAPAAPKEN